MPSARLAGGGQELDAVTNVRVGDDAVTIC